MRRRRERQSSIARPVDIEEPNEGHVQTNVPMRRSSSLARIIYVKEYCPQRSEANEIVLQPLNLLDNEKENY